MGVKLRHSVCERQAASTLPHTTHSPVGTAKGCRKRSQASQHDRAAKEGGPSAPRIWCELDVLGSSHRSVCVAPCVPISSSCTYYFAGVPRCVVSAVPASSAFPFRSTRCFTARSCDAAGRRWHPSGPARVTRLGQLPRVRARFHRRSATRRGCFYLRSGSDRLFCRILIIGRVGAVS
ncbi:hypothetical protein NDU88_003668 [Pleurodeles waltl]|uniref:Uncharacterized protein n=1 Tax=Pleurodeles waltl TaxID=8319 RepID=A0AAV7M600_PLEWA|nr:hypothetical protein NDU88_003668 [Pleurodeles waltl]